MLLLALEGEEIRHCLVCRYSCLMKYCARGSNRFLGGVGANAVLQLTLGEDLYAVQVAVNFLSLVNLLLQSLKLLRTLFRLVLGLPMCVAQFHGSSFPFADCRFVLVLVSTLFGQISTSVALNTDSVQMNGLLVHKCHSNENKMKGLYQ